MSFEGAFGDHNRSGTPSWNNGEGEGDCGSVSVLHRIVFDLAIATAKTAALQCHTFCTTALWEWRTCLTIMVALKT